MEGCHPLVLTNGRSYFCSAPVVKKSGYSIVSYKGESYLCYLLVGGNQYVIGTACSVTGIVETTHTSPDESPVCITPIELKPIESVTLKIYSKYQLPLTLDWSLISRTLYGFPVMKGSTIDVGSLKLKVVEGSSGYIEQSTKIIYEPTASPMRRNKIQITSVADTWIGDSTIKEFVTLAVKSFISKREQQNSQRGIDAIALIGPPGCGKTTFMREITRETGCVSKDFRWDVTGLKTTEPIETQNSDDTYMDVAVIDVPDIKNEDKVQSRRLATVIENLIQQDKVFVVLCSHKQIVNIDIHEVTMSMPNESERNQIIVNLFKEHKATLETSELSKLSKLTHGFSGADIKDVIGRLLPPPPETDGKLLYEQLEKAVQSFTPALLRTSERLTKMKQGIGLVNPEVTQLVEFIDTLNDPSPYRQMGIPPPRGVLVYGPQGTGKTAIVRMAADKEDGVTFLSTSSSSLFSMYVGESEAKLRGLLAQARSLCPSVLVIDSIEEIGRDRSDTRGGEDVSYRMLTTLLTELDGVVHTNSTLDNGTPLLFIGVTSCPWNLDPALLRPGRLTEKIRTRMPRARCCKGEDNKSTSTEWRVGIERLGNIRDVKFVGETKDLFQHFIRRGFDTLCESDEMKGVVDELVSISVNYDGGEGEYVSKFSHADIETLVMGVAAKARLTDMSAKEIAELLRCESKTFRPTNPIDVEKEFDRFEEGTL